MTIEELEVKYRAEELKANISEINTLKYELFSPSFTNLFENKLVYYEKFFCVGIVKDVKITPDFVSITAEPYLKIFDKNKYRFHECPNKPLKFGSAWEAIVIVNNSFYVPYANWRIWPEPELVKGVEDYILKDDFLSAIELTVGR